LNDPPTVPDPPPPNTLDPLISKWARGREIFHIHPAQYPPTAFNPNTGRARGRFHPFYDRQRRPVPTWYGASDIQGVIAEVIFQNAAFDGVPRLVRRTLLKNLLLSRLSLTRDLRLADLTGHGLRRLGLKRNQLLDTEADEYEQTVRWAEALYRSPRRPAGIIWISRQFDLSTSVVLFGNRIPAELLELVDAPLSLFSGRDLMHVLEAAEAAGLAIVE
jgi:hypothetical protein